jgi:hypothetical protein
MVCVAAATVAFATFSPLFNVMSRVGGTLVTPSESSID